MIRISIFGGLYGDMIPSGKKNRRLDDKAAKIARAATRYGMKTFLEFLSDLNLLSRLWLIETYFSFDPAQYNQLFDDELKKLSVSSPEHRAAVERMRGFNWVAYIAKSLRNAGYRDQREVQERTHDIVVKMLVGGLFTKYDERRHGSLDLRFKRSVANAIKNMVELKRNRRRFIPTISTDQDVAALPQAGDDDEGLIDDFRRLVRNRLGELGIAVLDARLQGQEVKTLVGREDLGRPGRFVIKRVVGEVKALAKEFSERLGDPRFQRDVERAMGREQETVQKRLATARQGRRAADR
jgi:hypothetical protein